MPTYIFINGPSRSGKDTVAGLVHKILYDNEYRSGDIFSTIDKLSAPIKRAFAGTMGLTMDPDFSVQPYEGKKETIIPILSVSYRQWQIDFSEKFMKPLYGQDIFSQLLLQRTDDLHDFVIVSDCGFQAEYDYVSGRAKCFLIQLHRANCDFAGDSREYVTGNPMIEFPNNGSMGRLAEQLKLIITTRIMPYHNQ